MAQPTSFRLPAALLERIDEEAAERGTTVTALVTSLLDEGLKTRRFPGIVFRDGPTGRRAGVIGGPDVWEIIRRVRQVAGSGERRVANASHELDMDEQTVRLAIDYYAAFSDEVDERIAIDERAADRWRDLVARREGLLAP